MPVEAIARFCQGELKIGCMEGECPETCGKPRCPLYPWRTDKAAAATRAIYDRSAPDRERATHRFIAKRGPRK
jgi:hypothetical protein